MEEKSGSEMQSAVNEARTWIEVSASTTSTNAVMMKPSLVSPPSQIHTFTITQAVTGKTLRGEFRESLEDGIVLCE